MTNSDSKNQHLIWIIGGAVGGVCMGTFFPNAAIHLEILGNLFLNALKMMVIPLVVTSIIVGIANLTDSKSLGSLGVKTVIFYTLTTGLAVGIGLLVVNVLQPGIGASEFTGELPARIQDKEAFSFMQVIEGMVQPNLFRSAVEFKILPIIIASILFGVAMVNLGEAAKPLIKILNSANAVIMHVVGIIIQCAPIGIFGLIAYRLGVTGGGMAVVALMQSLLKYSAAVILGLAIHSLAVLPLLLWIFTKRNPIEYVVSLSRALVIAFATASSSATLPITMKQVQEAGVSEKTSNVVLPLGATINMDGTALYEAVAAIYIAQCYGIDLSMSDQLIIAFTATLAAVGAAGIPEAGLVTMILVLQSVGLPVEGLGLILAVDWLLDRFRTTVNVWGDATAASIIDELENKEGVKNG
ncbi:MAG: solute carrier family 1 (high affinity glutamate transporter) protein 1 [Candidatus Omnitrophota bacterium]|jgi:solute carrier family 1 (high affinity glutamate transporter) protein 1